MLNPALVGSLGEAFTAELFRTELAPWVGHFVTDAYIDLMVGELGIYKISCVDKVFETVAFDRNPLAILHIQLLQFWSAHSAVLPHLFTFVRIAVLLQPSSASSERCFSILKRGGGGGTNFLLIRKQACAKQSDN